jgi:hypothetical protein
VIYLGLDNTSKVATVTSYCDTHAIRKVVVITPQPFRFACSFPNTEYVSWEEVILYKFFYRLLQEIDHQTLVVVNECLRTQNRSDLTYNCIRHYLNQTNHQLVFQYLPIIDTLDDFMILFDFDTRSRWKRERFDRALLSEATLHVAPVPVTLRRIPVAVGPKVHAQYDAEKDRLFASLGDKDPHTLPRNLALVAGKAKLSAVDPQAAYVGRNNRFKLPNFQTFKEDVYQHCPYTVFEWCHNIIDFIDFLSLSRQTAIDVLVADLKVDEWYFERYQNWVTRLNDAYASLQQNEDRS